MPTPLSAAPGQVLEDRFVLLEEIGRGGMSTVFKAQDLANGGELVAVKVPLPQYSGGMGSWSLFQQEEKIGARLRHPYVLRFISHEPSKHRNVVVTEFVDGTTLSSLIGKGRLFPEGEALRIASLLCEAVEYLHGEETVHYDVKPGNVILCKDGSIRLIDFGVAHALESGPFAYGGPAPPLATADYAAPEQIGRQRGQRSVDIYAIGAVLYEMLTGHPPFEGDDPFVIASARQIGDPRAPRALNPAISVETEEIVLRALRRKARERYATAGELKTALDYPTGVQVSGLASRLVEATPWRKSLRWMRYITLVAVVPLGFLVASFRVLWWYLEHKR